MRYFHTERCAIFSHCTLAMTYKKHILLIQGRNFENSFCKILHKVPEIHSEPLKYGTDYIEVLSIEVFPLDY